MPPKQTTVLAFDTSAAHCAAVLLRGGQIAAQRREELGRKQVERLFPLLEELLAEADLEWSDLEAVAVCTGPGNFTGTRIGVSAARGLAMSLNIPAVGVSALEALAMAASPMTNGTISVAVPLLRGQYGMQDFETGLPPVALGAPFISDETPAVLETLSAVQIARYATLIIEQNQSIPRPAPLYLRPADAAPAKNQPPVMLDDG